MRNILYIDENISRAKAVKKNFSNVYGFFLCTQYREARGWIKKLSPAKVLIAADTASLPVRELCDFVLALEKGPDLVMVHAEEDWPAAYPVNTAAAQRVFRTGTALCDLRNAMRVTSATGAESAPEDKASLNGASRVIGEANRLIMKYAAADYPVLIVGESGTGKEVAAATLHRLSRRNGSPLIALDCSAIPDNLVESQLFGTERGAFTDAVERAGNFEEAAGGTLFLDEIGNMSMSAQAKLLRVLESGEYRRLGGRRNLKAGFRLVSATAINLPEAVRAGTFRQDLLFRINTLTLEIPSLRSRPEDIRPMAIEFCLKSSGGNCVPGPAALEKLAAHQWPGNVRELRNVIHRGLVLFDGAGELRAEDIVF